MGAFGTMRLRDVTFGLALPLATWACDSNSASDDGSTTSGVAASSGESSGEPSSSSESTTQAEMDDAPPCSGCIELAVPVDDIDQSDGFEFRFTPPGIDLTEARIVWRVKPLVVHDQMFVQPYVLNGRDNAYRNIYYPFVNLGVNNFPPGEWTDVVLDFTQFDFTPPDAETTGVDTGETGDTDSTDGDTDGTDGGAAAGDDTGSDLLDGLGFDPSIVTNVGLKVGTAGAFVGTDVVRVAVDALTFEGTDGSYDRSFDSDPEGLVILPMSGRNSEFTHHP